MIRRLVASYVLLVAVALAAFTVPVAFTLTTQLRDDTEAAVRREASTMALLRANEDAASRDALSRMVRAYQGETPGRVEVLSSWSGGTTARWSSSALVVTAPASSNGAVRVSYPTSELNGRLWRIWGFRALLALGVLGVAAVLGALAARRLTRPLRELHAMASRFSDGDLTARSPVTGPSETQTLARTLNSGAERLESLMAAQRVFVADASHQLRTPLTALRLSLDNIADSVDDVSVGEDVEQATAELVRMSRLVNGLLTLARAEAKAGGAEPVCVTEVVEQRLAVWRPEGAERGVRFRLSGAYDARPMVLASPGHVDQVLDNVLSNALAVSPDGATITLDVQATEALVVLEVHDEGPGMPAGEKARAFDRFWRGRGLTGRSGSGLGLAIVRQLVTDADGSVVLGDAPAGGLSVRISLQAAAPRSGG
jgi:two-component system OmpR family sensor kinase